MVVSYIKGQAMSSAGSRRDRPPRVQIKYDDNRDGLSTSRELPFVVGVIGDFAGQPAEPPRPLRERKFVQIDRDNFDRVLEKMAPGLQFRVENTMAGGGSELPVTLKFTSLADFEPARVVDQVEPLRNLLEMRRRFRDLLAVVDGADDPGAVVGQFEQDHGLKAGADGPTPAETAEQVRARVGRHLGREVARIDRLVTKQLNAILHHPAFQRLEASWRGLYFLHQKAQAQGNVRLRVLHCHFKELARDVQNALEFDQSEAFKKVYGPFDTPGDDPFGLIVGDYEFNNHPDHIEVLDSMAAVAAAAFAPFIASASPALLDLKSFADLERPLNLPATFAQLQYVKWRALREKEDSRFVGLTLPRVLMRAPYEDGSHRTDRFRFHEDTTAPDRSGYLWGSAAYPYAAVLIRTFLEAGWLADTRGVRKGEDVGGLVTGLPALSWSSDRPGVAPRCPTDAVITDVLDRTLGELGFLPLCWCQDTHLAAFHGCQSLANPKAYDRAEATSNARLSAMLPYVLCAARFAHYLKVMMRDKTGGVDTPERIEDYLMRWLQDYTNTSDAASPELKARYPLRDSRVEVKEVPGKPGKYFTHIFLQPQFQLDQLVGFIELKTRPDTRRP